MPKCDKRGNFTRIRKEKAYQCAWCGHHIHPMAGTPFERSRTPLQKWFYAMYLFTTSRYGVHAKELQRQLGVAYNTAWRMGHEIRKFMASTDGDDGLDGHVKMDETYIAGKGGAASMYDDRMTAVFGMIQRDGNATTRVLLDARRNTLSSLVNALVAKGSRKSTYSARVYDRLTKLGYHY